MKKHISTILFTLLFLTGLSVVLYPAVSNYLNSKSQSKAVASYMERMEQLDATQNQKLLEEAMAYNQAIALRPDRFSVEGEERDAYLRLLGSNGGAVGYLEIESIKVRLPVYLGDSESVLQAGVGTLPGSSLPVGGQGTHAVLTGHRGLPSSRLFTDLDQVREGDVFVLHVLNRTLSYQVDQIKTVAPQDFAELEILPEQDLCTLVTCTPYGINTHRMLVRGRRIENLEQPAETEPIVTEELRRTSPVRTASIAAVSVLAVVAIVLLLPKHKKS